MEDKQQKHIIDLLFVITLFCLFALSAIFLISIGADIYGKTVKTMDSNFNTRTAIAYLTEKVHQSDQDASLSIGSMGVDCPAIIISSQISNTSYKTCLYVYDGSLCELIVPEDVILGPQAGQKITAASALTLTLINDELFRCILTVDEQHSYELFISVHSGGLTNET